MKTNKKLSLNKISITQLDKINGGNYGVTGTQFPTQTSNVCNTGLECQYTQTPTSMIYCVNMPN